MHAGTPEPRIRLEARGFWFEFPYSADYLRSVGPGGESAGRDGQSTQETREKVLRLIRERPAITTKELAEEIGITTKGIEWQLSRLKAGGAIRRVGADRGGRWEALEDVHD